jgi:integrase
MNNRSYKKVNGRTNIAQILKKHPKTGKEMAVGYSARGYVFHPEHGRVRRQKHFDRLRDAEDFVNGLNRQGAVEESEVFGEVLERFIEYSKLRLQRSTMIRYTAIAKDFLRGFKDIPIREIKPKIIDDWINWLKSPESGFMDSPRRRSFKHELDLLSAVLTFYREHDDSNTFLSPIKRRHREAVILYNRKAVKNKNLTEPDFKVFIKELKKQKDGEVLADLAVVQYYHALRISEAAGIRWEDVALDQFEPKNSRLTIQCSVQYLREKGAKPELKSGYKNSKAVGVKEHPMFKMSYEVFARLYHPWQKGPVFMIRGELIKYRKIQYAYNRAFKAAGLEFTATHVMRHGGCRWAYNQTGDLSVAQQHLGNTDIETTRVYAQREAAALTKVAHQMWDNSP